MTPLERAAKAAGDAITESTKGLSLHPETCVAAVRAALETLKDLPPDLARAGEGYTTPASTWWAILEKVIE